MEFAAKDNFKKAYRHYITCTFSGPAAANINVKMPTLLPNKRTMSRWTLRNALSVGSYGKIFFALDQSANVAAIKVVEQTS